MNISSGKNPPDQINVYIEIPQGSNIKYELDKESGVLMVDRFLFTAFSYPFNYGFVPNTKSEDGDPEDVLVISSYPVQAGVVIPAKPIGALEMEDEAGIDTKILAVPIEKIDPIYGAWNDLDDVPEMIKAKIKHFFEHYKELEPGKWVKVKNFIPAAQAKESIQKHIVK